MRGGSGLLILQFPDGFGELFKRSVNLSGFVGNGVGERLQIFLGGHLHDTQTNKHQETKPGDADSDANKHEATINNSIHILTFLIETEI